ncbi:MAG: response regulator [Nitrospiraceae bacterium]|nr:response regulator [Nitrospiraceae bacterium]
MQTKSILAIDDEEIVRMCCSRILRTAGYDVDTSSGGPGALEMTEEKKYDVVLTDLKMPGMDGIALMVELKKRLPDARVIVVTGYSTIETATRAMTMGAYNYLEKPFSPESLLAVVRDALGEKV